MAEIITLNISDDFSKKIKDADGEIKKLVITSEDARNRIIQHFKDMGNLGVDEFVRKVKLAQEAMKALASGDIKATALGTFAGEAAKAGDAANKLIEALLKISTANLERIAKNKELQEMHAIINARRKEAAEYKQQQNEIKKVDNETKQRKRELVQQDKDNANQARITAERRKVATEKEVQTLRREQQQLKLNEATFKSYAKAIMMSEVSNSSRIKKIERLRTVLREMQRDEHKYGEEIKATKQKIKDLERENRRVEESVKRVKKAKRNLMDTAGQLQRKLALLFSISQIIGYFNKLVGIRKEMELQQKSLQILLQNKDEADKLWNQVIDLAVKSPFRVKELVTYTKQLAAYRIESEQLFDTTKRLSDVSAGLGVDMQRLILAYGQIRAAGFLRGTELRQLTEAGIPMLDELAKYLTEIEGRAIKTGDVFEMISKRMISFEDVAEVFKRMTSEGGVFFNMQEEQAKTLHGQISNLYDSIDLMLNDIGKYYDSDLKGGVQSLREFVAAWRDVSTQIKATLVLLSPFIAYSTLARLANSRFAESLYSIVTLSPKVERGFRRINTSIDWWGRKSKAASMAANLLKTTLAGLSTLGVGLALAGITYALSKLWVELTRSSRESKELKRNLDSIVNEDTSNLFKQIEGYKNLSTRLAEANEGSQERRDIISKLNSEYGEYLGFAIDEKTTIEDLAKAYEDVVKRMKEKAALATFEKGMQAISDSYGKSLEDATQDFYDLLGSASIKKTGDKFGLSSITPTKKEIDDIFNLVQTRIRESNKEAIDDLTEQQNLIQEIIKGYYGEDFFLSRDYLKSIELIDIMVQKKEREEELQKQINREYKETLKSKEANLAFEKLQNDYAEKQRKIRNTEGLSKFEVNKQLEQATKQFELDKIDLKLQFGEISEESARKAKDAIINWASTTVKEVNDKIAKELSGKFTEEEYSQILISQEEYGKGLSAILKNTTEGWELANSIIAEQISLKSSGLPIDEKLLERAEKQAELYKIRAEYLGIELDYVKKIDKESVKSINSQLDDKYQISLEDSYKSIMQLQEQANKKRQDAIALEAALNLQKERGVAINEEELKQIQADVKGWTKLWELLGGKEKKKDGGGRSNSLYDERIKVIDDMNKKYKELNKTLSHTESLQGAFEAYIDAFSDAFKGVSWVPKNVNKMTPQEFTSKVLNFPDENALVSFLDTLAKEPMKAFEKIKVELAKGEYVYDLKVRTKVEDDQKLIDKIEEMFSGYELSLELEKLNIPPDLAKQLFNVDTLTLDELRDKVADAIIGVEFYNERMKDAGELMKQTFQGNVDLLNRKLIPAQDLAAKGWEDVGDGIATVFSSSYGVLDKDGNKVDILVTPILPDGTVLSQKELEDYITNNLEGVENILQADKKGIVISVGASANKGELLHELQEVYYAESQLSKDMKAKYREFLKKIDEMEEKAQVERLKKYTQYLVKGQGERVKIKMEEMRQLAEIEKLGFTESQKELARQAIQKESKQKMDKLEWEDFKDSGMYVQLFEDLEYVSTSALKKMREKLSELKTQLKDLDADDLKHLYSQIEKLDKEISTRNPYKSAMNGIDEYINAIKNAKKLEEDLLSAESRESDLKNQEANVSKELALEQAKFKQIKSNLNASGDDVNKQYLKVKELETQLALLRAQLIAQGKLTDKIEEQLEANKQVRKSFTGDLAQIGSDISEAANALPQVAADLENVFGAMDAGTRDTIDSISTIGSGVGDAIQGFASQNYIQAVAGIAKAIGGIFAIGDKKKERQIQREIKVVEDLERAYEKLEKQIDEAYAIDTLEQSGKKARENIESQIDSYEKMIAAEEDKKKTDKDRIKEWELAIDDLIEQKAELDKELVSIATGGILDDIRSAAQEFTDAWLEAFNETGDGLQGLENNFKETMLEMVKQQGAMLISQAYIEKWKKQLEQYINPDDLELTTDEAQRWVTSVTNSLPQLNDALERYFEAMKAAGVDISGGKESELTGLQRGIQGITEQQSDILAAYLNSIRFFVAEQTTYLQAIAASYTNAEIENPMVSQLRIIAQQTSAIHSLLDSLTSGGHSMGGRGFRVFIS